MNVLYLILYILAAVCFVLAASGRVASKYNLVASGLFFWVLVPLIMTAKSL